MPFYGFGPLKVTAVRDIGSSGPAEGPPVVVECPLHDSLRSVYPWFALTFLMLLRRSNRTRQAWAVFLPLLAIYGILHIAENGPDGPMAWYVSMHIRAFVCEALRALALGIALLVAISDSIRMRSAFLRRLLVLVVVLSGGIAAILLNAPFATNSAIPVVAFAAIVLISAFGVVVISVLLRWLLGRHDLRWHIGVYLMLGVGPFLLVRGVRLLLLYGPHSLLSTLQQITIASIVSQVLFAPYFVFFCFALLALLSPANRRRLANCLGNEISTSSDIRS